MTLLIIALACLILFSGFLSCSETALFSLSSLTLKSYKQGRDKKELRVAYLMDRPRDVLVTILMLNVLSNLLVQNTVSSLFASFDDWTLKVGVPLALTLVFGEVLPKSIALPQNTKIAPKVAPFIAGAAALVKPIRVPLTKATFFISRLFFFFLRKEKDFTGKELKHLLKLSEEKKILLPQECDLIDGTLQLQHSLVKERMRPREEIRYYDIQEPLSQLAHLFIDLEITRVPVCDGDLEKVLGILSNRDFFFQKDQIKEGKDLRPILKKPYFVPETTKAFTLLKTLKERDESLAIAVDEYGSISGLATQEDLIEAVVGEIVDRRDPKSLYTRPSPDVIIASGKLELTEFSEIFDVPLHSKENAVTLGGWLIEQLGDIPQTGTKYATDDFFFYVLAAEPHRVKRIYVRRLKSPRIP